MNLHVSIPHTITLSDAQIREVTINKLRRIIRPGEYLREGKDGTIWLTKDEDGWRHGSISEEPVREATELDIAIFKVLDHILHEKF